MSDFVPEGNHFANVYSDSQDIHSVAEWADEKLEYKCREYWEFIQREDLMPRAQEAAKKIIDYIGFEIDYRTGVYEMQHDASSA